MLRPAEFAAPLAMRSAATFCALAIVFGPLYTDPGYEWTRHSVSELAGQATSNAWIMRIGLLALGLSAVLGYVTLRSRYNVILLLFGICIALTGVFPHRPITPGVPFSARLDQLHSLFASLGGFFAVAGFALRAFRPGATWDRTIAAALALLFSLLSVAMFLWPEYQGLFQRGIFAAFIAWVLIPGSTGTAR